MPNKDGSGPEGKGPKTGRGMGRCANTNSGAIRSGQGRGLRRNAPSTDRTAKDEK